MNNKYIATLICITVLTLAPACKKHQPAITREDVNTMIETENSIIEIENDAENQESVVKF